MILLSTAMLMATARIMAMAEPPGLPTPTSNDSNERMWVQAFPLTESRHILLIVDPIERHIAVYHVDTVSGALTLKSSRDISADLRLGDFNAQDPKPATLRKMLEMTAPAGSFRPPRDGQ
jgi:hypothetical protein